MAPTEMVPTPYSYRIAVQRHIPAWVRHPLNLDIRSIVQEAIGT